MHLPSSEVTSGPVAFSITFVDRDNFTRLQSAHFKMEDFVTVVRSGKPSSQLSVMTHAYLCELNTRLSELVLGQNLPSFGPNQSTKEAQYTEFSVWDDMTRPRMECEVMGDSLLSRSLTPQKPHELCYDALPVDGQNLLIVVQQGFLYHLADSKDNYKQFVLACIRCMDRFNCDLSQLNQLYLQLQLSEAPFELLRCRIQ
jgi:hypothetical protein